MRIKIGHKLVLAVAVVSVTIISGFSYLLSTSQQAALIAQVEHNAHQVSETIKSGTKSDMLLNLPDRLHDTIDTIGRQEGIDKVRIFNKVGEIIYSSERQAVGTMVDKRAEACYACHAADQALAKLPIDQRTRIFGERQHGRTLGIINPIYNEPNCWNAACHAHDETQTVLGVLDVTMSLEEVDSQMAANNRRVLLFTFTAVVAIGAMIWVFIENLVGKPVNKLVRATETVAAGDLSSRLRVKRSDELGHLARSFNEMTDRLAEVQQQLYQSDKLASLGRLAAGVAHEINNPLTGVLTYSSFLLKRAEENPDLKEDLETIVRETKRCRDIVKGLLDFSRQAPVRMTNVDLDDVITHSVGIVQNRLDCDGIAVVREVAAGLPPVRADANQLTQVLVNLLVNAADAIGTEGGAITVSAGLSRSAEAEEIELQVIDTGCGIAPADVGRVFEPFHTTKGREGTGLGLAVVWGIVEKHGGRLDLESEPGRGTTVTLRLPVPAAPARGRAASA